MTSSFQHPKDEAPIVAWARSAKLSYYPYNKKLIIEVILTRDGNQVIGRSLTLFLEDEYRNSSTTALLKRIVEDLGNRGLPPEDLILRRKR